MKNIHTALAVAALWTLCSFSAIAAGDNTVRVDVATLKNAAINHHNADAAFSLCAAYYNGHGVTKNEAEADKWCKKSSENLARRDDGTLSGLQSAR